MAEGVARPCGSEYRDYVGGEQERFEAFESGPDGRSKGFLK